MPDVSTEVAIATQTLGSNASSITFSSIPATYTDLRIVLVSLDSSANGHIVQYNSDTATNYSYTNLSGSGTAAASGRGTSSTSIIISGWTNGGSSTIPTMQTIDIFSYAGSTNKTLLARSSNDLNGSGEVLQTVGLWRSTAAITSIVLGRGAGTYNTGTTATLYGIL